ncbi:apicoplast pyruvate carrier 1-like isoform X2 [Babylonia areolata]|uniref:apicoplast pyruvate carrier 1-like isoform X2 n=1 Tax=Babylonia areolata TaxID=304850 RepID=UPI003FD32C58
MANIWGPIRVIIGGVLIHLTLGTFYTFGNLSPYLTSYIRQNSSPKDLTYAESVWISALSGMGQGLTMYIGGSLEKRLGTRLTVLLGGWFQSLGILLTYFTIKHSFAATMITYGLMFGFGIGVAYAVPLAVGMRWLPNRKGLVNGCVVAGFGGGAFIFNLVQTAFINPENKPPDTNVHGEMYFSQEDILQRVPYTFLVLGGTYAVMQLLGCVLLSNPPSHQASYSPLPTEQQEDSEVTSLDDPQCNAADGRSSADHVSDTSQLVRKEEALGPRDVLKQKAFYQLWFIFLLNGQGVLFVSTLYKAYGQTFIADDVFLAWVGTFAAFCNAGGRIFWGSVADRYSFKTAMLCLCTMFTILMLTLGLSSVGGRWMFLLWVGLLFMAFSGSFSLLPTATARSFGHTYVANNYGLVFTSQVITSPIAAVLTMSLKSAIGWYGMFYMVSAFSFTSFWLTVFFRQKMPDGSDV